MSEQVDIRARLDEIKARADDCQSYNFGMRNADRLAHEDAPAMAAALTAMLDLLDKVADEDEITTQADGVHVPVYLVRAAITERLGATVADEYKHGHGRQVTREQVEKAINGAPRVMGFIDAASASVAVMALLGGDRG